MKETLKKLSPDERAEFIKQNSVFTESTKVKRHFTNDEIAEMQKDVAQICIDQENEAIRKKEFMDQFNATAKSLKIRQKEHVKNIRNGFEITEVEVFAFDDQERGVMEYYDITGNLINTRPLLPSERQFRIIPMTGTNGMAPNSNFDN